MLSVCCYTAPHCTTLHHTHCTTLHCTALHCDALCIMLRCIVLSVLCCAALQARTSWKPSLLVPAGLPSNGPTSYCPASDSATSCYILLKAAASYAVQKAACTSLNGYLAVLSTPSEQLEVETHFRAAGTILGPGSPDYYYIGLEKLGINWYWLDGRPHTTPHHTRPAPPHPAACCASLQSKEGCTCTVPLSTAPDPHSALCPRSLTRTVPGHTARSLLCTMVCV